MSNPAGSTVEELIGRISQVHDKATPRTVFGDPIRVNGRTIIPVARVSYGFGFGMGRNSEREREEEEASVGGGGGGGLSIRPVAILEITEKETRIRPVVDLTRMLLAGMALIAWNFFWVMYTARSAARRRQ
ncbi:MAG: GerW family sporulation protein [bacterium]